MSAEADFEQIRLQFVDPIQHDYEVIRPVDAKNLVRLNVSCLARRDLPKSADDITRGMGTETTHCRVGTQGITCSTR